tara:strand:- start:304 stop:486 length:183 start_codon:yes stop_codon:yes gene_type:complete
MEEVIVDSIPRIQPLTLKTPIVEIEADYGSPVVDGTVIVIVLVVLYAVKKIIDRIKINEP